MSLTSTERAIAALRVAACAAVDAHAARWATHHMARRAYREMQAARLEKVADGRYAPCTADPCHGRRAAALEMAYDYRALAYAALADGDAASAAEHWRDARDVLRRHGMTAGVWKR